MPNIRTYYYQYEINMNCRNKSMLFLLAMGSSVARGDAKGHLHPKAKTAMQKTEWSFYMEKQSNITAF